MESSDLASPRMEKQPWDTVEPIKQLTAMITKITHIHSRSSRICSFGLKKPARRHTAQAREMWLDLGPKTIHGASKAFEKPSKAFDDDRKGMKKHRKHRLPWNRPGRSCREAWQHHR